MSSFLIKLFKKTYQLGYRIHFVVRKAKIGCVTAVLLCLYLGMAHYYSYGAKVPTQGCALVLQSITILNALTSFIDIIPLVIFEDTGFPIYKGVRINKVPSNGHFSFGIDKTPKIIGKLYLG